MKHTSIMGIIFADTRSESFGALTSNRTTAGLPFCGRYRLADFTLSNMVHAGVTRVGILPKTHFRSLMKHFGNGKAWDLSRKHGGLYVLPPFSGSHGGAYTDAINALIGVTDFIEAGNEELILLSDCDSASNLDLSAAVRYHLEQNNGITAVYKHVTLTTARTCLRLDGSSICGISHEESGTEGDVAVAYIYNRKFLLRVLAEATENGYCDFELDMVVNQGNHTRIGAIEARGEILFVDGFVSYYNANLALLSTDTCSRMFLPERPVFTGDTSYMPAKIGEEAVVTNSLISSGCDIEGTVINSVLFRGVRVGKGAVVRDSVIINGTVICNHANVSCAVIDRDSRVENEHSVIGTSDNPTYVGFELTV